MEKDILINFIEQGLSTYEIVEKTNKSQGSICYWLKKYGLKTQKHKIGHKDFDYKNIPRRGAKRFEKNDIDFWKNVQIYLNENHTWLECSKHFNIPLCSIRKAKQYGLIKTRSLQEAMIYYVNHKETAQEKLERKQRGVESACRAKLNGNPFGGYRHGAGTGKKFKVVDSFGQPVTLQSSYEYMFFEILTKLNINWIRPSYLFYELDCKRKYFPDFYLIDYKIYVDTKNSYYIKKDASKILAVEKYNNVKIHIIPLENINEGFIINLTGSKL